MARSHASVLRCPCSRLVRFAAEQHQAVAVHVRAQWGRAQHQQPDSDPKLAALYEEWVGDVALGCHIRPLSFVLGALQCF